MLYNICYITITVWLYTCIYNKLYNICYIWHARSLAHLRTHPSTLPRVHAPTYTHIYPSAGAHIQARAHARTQACYGCPPLPAAPPAPPATKRADPTRGALPTHLEGSRCRHRGVAAALQVGCRWHLFRSKEGALRGDGKHA